MKKFSKKLLQITLVFVLIITLIPVTAFGGSALGEDNLPAGGTVLITKPDSNDDETPKATDVTRFGDGETVSHETSGKDYNANLDDKDIVAKDPTNPAQIKVGSVVAAKGQTVKIPLEITNNPGVASVRIMLSYDNQYITLKNVTDLGLLGVANHSDDIESVPYVLSWENDTDKENHTQNGKIVELEFETNENMSNGIYNMAISFAEAFDCDEKPVVFEIHSGGININDYLVGDINGDGEVNTKDRMYLSRHLADWLGYKRINEDVADVNGDGELNAKDRMFLSRNLAGWKNYETFTYVPSVNKLVIDLYDIEDISETEIIYYDINGRLKSVSLDENTKEYFNGILNGRTVNYEDLPLMSGKIVLKHLNENTTADYDTVNINASFIFVVDGVRESLSQVKSKVSSSYIKTISFDENDKNIEATLYGADGEEMNWADLKEDDVLCVEHAKTSEKECFTATFVSNTVNGMITGLNGKAGHILREATINEKTYKVLPIAELEQTFKVGYEGTFYLDDNNKIVYFKNKNSTPEGGGSSSDTEELEDKAVFVLKISETTDEDGNDIYVVTGYKNFEVVIYETDTKPNQTILGSLVIPELDNSGKITSFIQVANTSGAETVISKDGETVTESLYYGTLTKISGRNLTVDDKTVNTKFNTNVYVFDENKVATGRGFYQIDADDYLDYDEYYGLYYGTHTGEYNLDVDVYIYYAGGEVMSLVYYIK